MAGAIRKPESCLWCLLLGCVWGRGEGVFKDWRELLLGFCFLRSNDPASSGVSAVGTGLGAVERLPLFLCHTSVEPPLQRLLTWLCPTDRSSSVLFIRPSWGYVGQYGLIRFYISAQSVAGHRLQSSLRALRRGGDIISAAWGGGAVVEQVTWVLRKLHASAEALRRDFFSLPVTGQGPGQLLLWRLFLPLPWSSEQCPPLKRDLLKDLPACPRLCLPVSVPKLACSKHSTTVRWINRCSLPNHCMITV